MRMVGSVRWDGVEEKARREEREELDGMTLSDRPRERDMVARVGGLCRAERDGWCEVGSCWIKCRRETGGGGESFAPLTLTTSSHLAFCHACRAGELHTAYRTISTAPILSNALNVSLSSTMSMPTNAANTSCRSWERP